MKVTHVQIDDLVHRRVTSSNGLTTLSCGLYETHLEHVTDAFLTRVPCIARDSFATARKLMRHMITRLSGGS